MKKSWSRNRRRKYFYIESGWWRQVAKSLTTTGVKFRAAGSAVGFGPAATCCSSNAMICRRRSYDEDDVDRKEKFFFSSRNRMKRESVSHQDDRSGRADPTINVHLSTTPGKSKKRATTNNPDLAIMINFPFCDPDHDDLLISIPWCGELKDDKLWSPERLPRDRPSPASINESENNENQMRISMKTNHRLIYSFRHWIAWLTCYWCWDEGESRMFLLFDPLMTGRLARALRDAAASASLDSSTSFLWSAAAVAAARSML